MTSAWWISVILQMSQVCGIKPAHIESLIRVESTYCYNTVSKTSTARGCLQTLRGNMNVFDLHDSRHPEHSIRKGVDYLCSVKKSFPRTYLGRFHVGNGKLEGDVLIVYENYVKKLDTVNNKYFRSLK